MFREPGAETTPFPDPFADGWEDDLSRPRTAGELVEAFESTWRVIEGCLARWTPAMLGDEFRREIGGRVQLHTRESVLLRLITHDAYHAGEIAQVFG
ncbi:MAG: DinB family protein, partial [Chloroflexi bacterium]|nr:DinB family protein [Chloroflexota bacterium]